MRTSVYVCMCVCVAQMSKNLWQLMPNVAREQGIGILGQGAHTQHSTVKLSCKQNWFAAAAATTKRTVGHQAEFFGRLQVNHRIRLNKFTLKKRLY